MLLGIAMLVQRSVPKTAVAAPLLPHESHERFLTRWLRVMWRLFWNTTQLYIVAVLLLGTLALWLA
ncbi:hypothetical protein E05_18920 [Plautia stali symbiont]|nr:hypothetical protein E05_18920 [Plautia stali symbiont]